jgi:hypothetical protein
MISEFIILLCPLMLEAAWLAQNACDVYPFLPLILLGKMEHDNILKSRANICAL